MLGGIGLALLSTLALAAASINCTIPEIPEEGCGFCYNYTVAEVVSGFDVVETTTTVVDFDACHEAFKPVTVPDSVCMNFFKMDVTETREVPIMEKVCTVGSVPLYQTCLNTTERVFILASPTVENMYPSSVICYWNIPEPASGPNTGIYLSLTARDIQQVSGSCDDKLMIHSDAWSDDLVTCGMSHGLPAVINNDFLQHGVETFFVSNETDERMGFELLVVYSDPPVSKRHVIFPGTCNHTVDIWGSRNDATFSARGCECRPLNKPIEELCSSASLDANQYYSLYREIAASIPDGGRYGFNGYKGCPGAEFFRCGSTTSVGSLTEEECRSFRLGMTPKEAETFLVLRDQMWNGYTPDDTCSDTPATRPDPHELVQLHHMVYSPDYMARADECAQSDNLIVKTVADHIKNGKPISYIRPN